MEGKGKEGKGRPRKPNRTRPFQAHGKHARPRFHEQEVRRFVCLKNA